MAKVKKKNPTTGEKMLVRPPIITIMGHVDHGKTSILDAIREDYAVGVAGTVSKSKKLVKKITSQESGGITQHIGAYTVEKDGKRMTFIDTPGHEAFTQMRARGGKAADIVILVVAADDGVMPQTKEAIMHAKAANVPIIVALNKIDLPGANSMRVKQQLAENGIAVEGFGGDIVVVETSATKKTGISELLDVILLISEMETEALSADPEGNLRAVVIESRHDPKRGVSVAAIVKNGTVKVRDEIVVSGIRSKIKSLTDSIGNPVPSASLGDAVEILGLPDVPSVGETIYRVGEEVEETSADTAENLPNEPENIEDSNVKKLNLVIRADTVGTLEAIVAAISKLHVADAKATILFAGTGDVKESDILLASTGKAVVMAFKVGVPSSVADIAKTNKIIIREHEIIYKLIEEIEGALEGVVEIEEAKIKGKGLVIQTFVLPKSNTMIAGTLVVAGKFKTGQRIGIFRGKEIPEYVARIKSIHVGPKEVDLATKGMECGLLFKPAISDVQLDDEIEVL